jgi:uncharacterized protein YlxW (UPF0749 family)
MARRSRLLLAAAFVVLGFLVIIAIRGRPGVPANRLPRRFQLAGLIQREQRTTSDLRNQVAQLRRQVDDLRKTSAGQQTGAASIDQLLGGIRMAAGLDGVRGPGLRVVLDDSDLKHSPSGNVNDLVIHSQDVQAAVNALWSSGAEAVAINGQRVVSTSAVLCVGNTLLLNGSVYSPPYEITALGASPDRFEQDQLVKRLHHDAEAFGLRFSVATGDNMKVPAFAGVTAPKYAKVNR